MPTLLVRKSLDLVVADTQLILQFPKARIGIARQDTAEAVTNVDGHGIATAIQRTSEDVLLVDHGSLYPALQRLERSGLISSDWGTSDNNRKARFYKLTRTGRARLTAETGKWEKMVRAVSRVLKPGKQEA